MLREEERPQASEGVSGSVNRTKPRVSASSEADAEAAITPWASVSVKYDAKHWCVLPTYSQVTVKLDVLLR